MTTVLYVFGNAKLPSPLNLNVQVRQNTQKLELALKHSSACVEFFGVFATMQIASISGDKDEEGDSAKELYQFTNRAGTYSLSTFSLFIKYAIKQ